MNYFIYDIDVLYGEFWYKCKFLTSLRDSHLSKCIFILECIFLNDQVHRKVCFLFDFFFTFSYDAFCILNEIFQAKF